MSICSFAIILHYRILLKEVFMNKDKNPQIITLMVVEPNNVLRESIIATIENYCSKIKVNASCATNKEAVELAQVMDPSVILINFENLKMSNYEIAKKMLKYNNNMKIIVYSMIERYQYVEKSMNAGASGFIDLGLKTESIVNTIKSVHYQLSPFIVKVSHEVTGKTKSWIGSLLFAQLSNDEELILGGMLKGYSSSEIADMTAKDIKVIQRKKSSIRKKLDVKSDFDLLFFALQEGYYKLENYTVPD